MKTKITSTIIYTCLYCEEPIEPGNAGSHLCPESRSVSHRDIYKIKTAIEGAISTLEPIARTGQVSQGGEQRGNRIDVEWTLASLRLALGLL